MSRAWWEWPLWWLIVGSTIVACGIHEVNRGASP